MFCYLYTRDNIHPAIIYTRSSKQKLYEKEIKKRPFNRSIDDRQDKYYPSLPTPTRLAVGFGLQEICPTCCAGFTPVTTGSPASTLWNSAIAIDFICYIIIQKKAAKKYFYPNNRKNSHGIVQNTVARPNEYRISPIIRIDFDLCLFDKLRFKLHLTKTVNLAFDVMVSVYKTYVFYLCTYFQR